MPAHRPNVVMALPRVGKPPVSATFSGQNDAYVIWVSERRIGYQARALNRQVRPRIGVYAPYRVAEGPSPAGGTGTPRPRPRPPTSPSLPPAHRSRAPRQPGNRGLRGGR